MVDIPYKLASRASHPESTVVKVKSVEIGGKKIVVMAGPCAVESDEQLMQAAKAVKEAGASVLRASAYKPRSSPYSFQGLEEEGLKLIKKAGGETGLITETEVIDTRDVGLVSKYVDILRIGARNMQNFALLKEVGKAGKPVILKNGIASTLEEFLLAAEYILSEGNKDVILCYRGVKGFEPKIRFPLDIATIPLLKELTHLPVIVDPSHSTGKQSLVGPVSKAAIAAGADGLMVEVHPNPGKAKSDKAQQLLPDQFSKLMQELSLVARAVGRGL
jgi:3-deoxy-7-phosphoheptulonate synthase